jgi:hypothetical protein
MLAVTLLVASIAVADSLNPSTVVPALWLARASTGRSRASFTLGVFAVSFAGWLLLVFGPGNELLRALRDVSHVLRRDLGDPRVAFRRGDGGAALARLQHAVPGR